MTLSTPATSPDWAAAFTAVQRAHFIPDRIWRDEPGQEWLEPVDRSTHPEEWAALVNPDVPVITQVDDGTPASPHGRGALVTSSASMPSVVARMLAALDVTDGMTVLEIGTGTGYNAALLTHRLGQEWVTTIEVDPALAECARAVLAQAGYRPRVVTGDGAHGYAPGAPYDRVIATAAVTTVPPAWVRQAAPGGLILTPWATSYHNGALARLLVDDHGAARGHFAGDVSFMRLRQQRAACGDVAAITATTNAVATTTTDIHPYWLVGDYDAAFAIGLLVPNCRYVVDHDNDGAYTVTWVDPVSRAWARLDYTPDTEVHPVTYRDSRRALWHEISAAHTWWNERQRPVSTRFGLTVSPDGHQQVWLGDPANPLPTQALRD